MKRLILYDLDGTLVDTGEDITRATNHMRESFGKEALSRDQVSRFVGRGLHYLIEQSLGTKDEKTVEKGGKIYRDFYVAHMMDNSVLYPGALDFLDHFKDRTQAVITNKPNPFSIEMLETLKVAPYFVEIIGGNSEFPKKPSPVSVQHLMQRGNISPEETLFIGDSLIDIETGRNAGITIGVLSHGFSSPDELQSGNPDFLVGSFGELLQLAKREKW